MMHITMEAQILRFPVVQDERGELVFAECARHVPFEIKRYYLIHSVPAFVARGAHAHIRGHQVISPIVGGFAVFVEGPDGVQKRFDVNHPAEGVYIPPMHWKVLRNFEADTICLVVTSSLFNEADYIRDYKHFKQLSGLAADAAVSR